MNHVFKPLILFIIIMILGFQVIHAEEGCLGCHQERKGFSIFHDPRQLGCSSCHLGNPEASEENLAHRGLEAFPGRMGSLDQTCGRSGCHEAQVLRVRFSVMHTVDGMLETTRRIFGEEQPIDQHHLELSKKLDQSGADSYLRKLCVSCHLGNEKRKHGQSLKARGGGCVACHLEYPQKPEKTEHPRLTVEVDNLRCFGCHSRSGRISLNYLGLAEVEEVDPERIQDFGRLPDRRLVERKAADLHSLAGMACIDCHTSRELMGNGIRDESGIDIQCLDCHRAELAKKPLNRLTPEENLYAALQPGRFFYSDSAEVTVTRRHGSALYHVRESVSPLGKKRRLLTGKVSGKELEIPLFKQGLHHNLNGHERLTCDSCHAAWAPQCYGCHIRYDANQKQWDHLLDRKTPGRWIESRWAVEASLPALGVDESGRITTFVPGMNLILEKTGIKEKVRHQLFSALSPHTTRLDGRSCNGCHQSDSALGIIHEHVTHPDHPEWILPRGWIDEGQKTPGASSHPEARSLNVYEIQKIRRVGDCLSCHAKEDVIYQDFKSWRSTLPVNHPSY